MADKTDFDLDYINQLINEESRKTQKPFFKILFSPKYILSFLCVILVSLLFLFLAVWQFSRAVNTYEDKRKTEEVRQFLDVYNISDSFDINLIEQKVNIKGYIPLEEEMQIISNRLQENRLGYWLVAPFVIMGNLGNKIGVIPMGVAWAENAEDLLQLKNKLEFNIFSGRLSDIEIAARVYPNESINTDLKLKEQYFSYMSSAYLINIWNFDLDYYDAYLVALDYIDADILDYAALIYSPASSASSTEINTLNIFYGIEWVIFVICAFFLVWRLARDEYLNQLSGDAEYLSYLYKAKETLENKLK